MASMGTTVNVDHNGISIVQMRVKIQELALVCILLFIFAPRAAAILAFAAAIWILRGHKEDPIVNGRPRRKKIASANKKIDRLTNVPGNVSTLQEEMYDEVCLLPLH